MLSRFFIVAGDGSRRQLLSVGTVPSDTRRQLFYCLGSLAGCGSLQLGHGAVWQFLEFQNALLAGQLQQLFRRLHSAADDHTGDGIGKIFFPEGDIYEGEFKNDMEIGCGILYCTTGERIEGEFINGKFYSHFKLINKIYRENVIHSNGRTCQNEKIIIMNDSHHCKLVNPDEKRIKVYLNKGITGTISRINKHVPNSKYVGFEFKPDFYYQAFDDLILDRYYLEGIEYPSRAMEPDEYVQAKFAYVLTVPLARINHWQKITLIQEELEYNDDLLFTMMMYTGMTRAKEKINIII